MIKEMSLLSRSEAQICRVETLCILVLKIMKCQTILCLKKRKILLCTMTAPPPGICLLMILIWIQTVCVKC